MQINITALSLVGQLVNHFDRWQDDPNQTPTYLGMTATKLSRITKVHRSTAYRNLEWLAENGFATYEQEPYKNTIRKRYYPTNRAIDFWRNFEPTDEGKKVSQFIEARWLKWYQSHIRKVYSKLNMKPPFRV